MKTYLFSQKNGSANITISADNKKEAIKELKLIVKDHEEFGEPERVD